jgi:alkaline phosphatase
MGSNDNSLKSLIIGMQFLLISATLILISFTPGTIPIANAQQADDVNISNNVSSIQREKIDTKRNVIFIHPDGTTQSHFSSARFLEAGPDGLINWDMLPEVAIYKGHMKDALTSTSHGGATAHASGIRVFADSYGCDGNCTNSTSANRTILEEARDEGYHIGIINSGTITEPGTGAFAAHVTERGDHCEIVRQIIEESGASLILGGGEKYYLSTNDTSFHPNPKNGLMPDNGECEVNMIEEARGLGYTVVFNETQLTDLNMTHVDKVLGIFAYDNTYNDMSERELFDDLGMGIGISEKGECDDVCRLYEPYAPTFDEMVKFGTEFLNLHSQKGFVLIAEEEGTDNFGNGNRNAEGMIEAARRADRAIGQALEFAKDNTVDQDTLVITAADSDAGGAAILSPQQQYNPEFPSLDENGCFVDQGLDPLEVSPDQEPLVDGITDFSIKVNQTTTMSNGTTPTNTTKLFCEKPFVAQPDQFGNQLLFGILWLPGGGPDVGGGTITRAYGCNAAEDVKGTLDNTKLPRIMAECLALQDLPPFEP